MVSSDWVIELEHGLATLAVMVTGSWVSFPVDTEHSERIYYAAYHYSVSGEDAVLSLSWAFPLEAVKFSSVDVCPS